MDLRLTPLAAGGHGHTVEGARVLLAPSAESLAAATGLAVPDAGAGLYLGAFWGEQSTGGYALAVVGALDDGERITVRFALDQPAPDLLVTQALTSPYALAIIHDRALADRAVRCEDQRGGALPWPVRRVAG